MSPCRTPSPEVLTLKWIGDQRSPAMPRYPRPSVKRESPKKPVSDLSMSSATGE
jgi:hypothetical protein